MASGTYKGKLPNQNGGDLNKLREQIETKYQALMGRLETDKDSLPDRTISTVRRQADVAQRETAIYPQTVVNSKYDARTGIGDYKENPEQELTYLNDLLDRVSESDMTSKQLETLFSSDPKTVPAKFKIARQAPIYKDDIDSLRKYVPRIMDEKGMGVVKAGLRKNPQLAYGGMLMYGDGGNLLDLPEYGFGSWLKDNGAGLLKGAGSLASMIPVIGNIAGPILSTAGSVIGGIQEGNAAADAQQLAFEQEQAAAAEQERVTNLATRRGNVINDKQVNYGATFEYGGQIGQGLMQQPQITDYSNGNTHQEGVGGIPVDAKGNPSAVSKQSAVGLTEKGEVTWNGYVFSDKLKF